MASSTSHDCSSGDVTNNLVVVRQIIIVRGDDSEMFLESKLGGKWLMAIVFPVAPGLLSACGSDSILCAEL